MPPQALVILLLSCLIGVASAGCRHGGRFKWGREEPATQPPAATTMPSEDLADTQTAVEPSAEPPSDEPVDTLQINDDVITVEDILRPVRADLTERAESMSPSAYGEYLVTLLTARVRDAARERLLYQEASSRLEKAENEMLDKFADQRIRQIVQEEYGGRHVRWERAMAEQGLSVEQARERVRRELIIIRHLQQTVGAKVQEPTRRELMHFFEQRKGEMTVPERRELWLIEVPKGDPPEAARAHAEQALSELNSGADFGEVARKYSQGVQAANGGAWGMVGSDSLRARWSPAVEALFQLPPGGTSEVIEADDAFFVVRVGKIEPRQEPDFTEMQIPLRKSYRDHQFNVLVDELVARLQERATIHPENLNLFLRAVIEASPTPTGDGATTP